MKKSLIIANLLFTSLSIFGTDSFISNPSLNDNQAKTVLGEMFKESTDYATKHLALALKNRKLADAELLIKQGADVNTDTETLSGCSALRYIVTKMSFKENQSLLTIISNTHVNNPVWGDILAYVTDWNTANFLIKAGADFRVQGYTLLRNALLLHNYLSLNNDLSLHKASYYRTIEQIESELLDHGFSEQTLDLFEEILINPDLSLKDRQNAISKFLNSHSD